MSLALLSFIAALGQHVAASQGEENAESCLLQHSLPREGVGQTQAGPATVSVAMNSEDPPTLTSTADSWFILGITDYSIQAKHDQDWWGEADVYAWVTVQPGGLSYLSQVIEDKNDWKLDLHIWVPTSATSARIDIHDQGTFFDSLIGTSHIDLGPTQTWCSLDTAASSGCTFSQQLKASSTTTGTVNGSLATGPVLEEQVNDLMMRGVAVAYQDSTRTKNKFQQFRIANDAVEHEMAYAKTGSVIPSSLQGIFWMDQRGRHLPVPSDPTYKQVCPVAADEILVSFGQGAWDPKTLCLKGLSVYGSGPLKSQWTWLDQTGNGSTSWASDKDTNAAYDFCFTDRSLQAIDIWTQTSMNAKLNSIFGFAPFKSDVLVAPPAWVTNVRMVRKPWGWDRHTTVGPPFVRQIIGSTLGGIMGSAGFFDEDLSCHYPVFQIVDGDGKRTEHYAAYLALVNNQTTCNESSFGCPRNRGKGTQMAGRLVA